MRYHSYLNSSKKIIESYSGDIPLALFLKKYFSANKKYGGRDRKQIATHCYHFYRLGKAIPQFPVEEKIITATFLCEQGSSDLLQFHKPEWNEIITKPLAEKLEVAGIATENIFPWVDELTTGIDFEPFCNSFLYQPDLFLRIRPGRKDAVIKKLQDAGIKFEIINEDCIGLSNATKLDTILELDKEVVVQDLNSQKVLDFLKNPVSPSDRVIRAGGIRDTLSVWDCCAASGGKSILAYDILKGDMEFTITDIRESILSNLKNRFETTGIQNYKSFVADLADPQFLIPNSQFQIVICDAPCTGSGTWSRTPEQLYFFKEKTINNYADKQQQIVSAVVPHLKTGGIFIYITCSVFKKENEAVVNFIKDKFHLHLVQMELLKGYDKKADSMFAAVFIKK